MYNEAGAHSGQLPPIQTISISKAVTKQALYTDANFRLCLFTAHQIVSLTGISFERKSIIVSLKAPTGLQRAMSVVLGFCRTHGGSSARQLKAH